MLSTTEKGNIGLYYICADLAEKQWVVLLPQGSQPHYDMIIEKGGKYRRVQARYATQKKNGNIEVKLYTQGHKTNFHSPKDVDVVAVFEPYNKKVYYINLSKFKNKTLITLRTKETKNGIIKNTWFAKNYCEIS